MSVTINVNGLSLCHKGSGGVAISTVPDVCKTPAPGGPVPIPYTNVSFSKDLVKGTKTISVDGGNMAAHQDSEFSQSIGDEAGSVGGVKSSTHLKEATWLTYSFDVKLEGRCACRLTDKMLMNHGNALCCAGLLQEFLRGPKGPDECARLLARIVLIIGEGMIGKTEGITGLEERMAKQITGAGAPLAPLDRGPNPSLGFPEGSNSWMRHDKELETQQKSLKDHLDAYDKHCKGGPPPPPNARSWVTKPRPQPSSWTGPALAPASPATGVNWGMVGLGAAAVGLTVLTAVAVISPFEGPVGDVLAGSAAAAAWSRLLGGAAAAAAY